MLLIRPVYIGTNMMVLGLGMRPVVGIFIEADGQLSQVLKQIKKDNGDLPQVPRQVGPITIQNLFICY